MISQKPEQLMLLLALMMMMLLTMTNNPVAKGATADETSSDSDNTGALHEQEDERSRVLHSTKPREGFGMWSVAVNRCRSRGRTHCRRCSGF